MVYLDNAATTFKKPDTVLRAVKMAVKKYSANPGRSGHRAALGASEIVYSAREALAEHLNYSYPERIVFTYNATYALNMAIKTLIPDNSHVIISDLEHNSVYRPIYSLSNHRGITFSHFNSSADNIFKEIEGLIRDNTCAIVSTLKSNVTGDEISLFALSELKRKHNLKLILDASQALGHTAISLDGIAFDALCGPAHKGLYGIMGLGFAVFSEEPEHTLVEGGSGNESRSPEMPSLLPERLEAGTVAVPAIAALEAGVKFIDTVGINTVRGKIERLTEETICRLSAINRVNILAYNSGLITFNYKDLPSERVAKELDIKGIATRAGLHCAPLAHIKLGTLSSGAVRISLSYFNNIGDIDRLYKALKKI